MKKLHLERPGRNLLTSMWYVIQLYHDLPTPSGYFPHQILFGRDQIKQRLPWVTLGKAPDYEEFMASAEEMAAKVTEALTKEHEKRHHYQEKAPVTKYKVGDPVWLERPSILSEHRQATYYVPAAVQKRLGEDTYTLKLGERLYRAWRHSQEKTPVSNPRGKHIQFDYADMEVDEGDPSSEEHEYNPLKILGYRRAPDVAGGYEFKTQWEGFGRTHESWEPASAFVPRYTQCFFDFRKRRKIDLKVTDVFVPKKARCTSLPPRG